MTSKYDAAHEFETDEVDAATWSCDLEADRARIEALGLTDALRARWAARLACEWDQLNWLFRLGLDAPALAIEPRRRIWGSWCRAERRISISERQIACYTWSSVVETLKHELAHQLVDERLGGDPSGPHGVLFARACAHLGISPRATGNGGVPLERPVPGESNADDARLRRIQKLLALADTRNNEHEAKVALAKAQTLILEYNVELSAAQTSEDSNLYSFRTITLPGQRTATHLRRLSAILAEFFFVRTVWFEGYDALADEPRPTLELVGAPFNLELAEHVWHYLFEQGERLWAEYRRSAPSGSGRAKAQYLDGMMDGFARHLRLERELVSVRAEEKALVFSGDQRLDTYHRRRHPRVRSVSTRLLPSSAAREAGFESGRKIRVHKPMREGAARRGHLLSPGED